MGFGLSSLRFVLSGKSLGLSGNSICTLGRQALFLTQRQLNSLLDEFGLDRFLLPSGRAMYFADDVLGPIGFERVDAMDASDYEGAKIIHDLNHPVPPELHEQYDLVWDGGTLEHIFNFPVALQNAMQMVKVGGHLVLETPANNQCGHGFYQFSPELFFRVFSEENGFELLRIYMHCKGRFYHIVDPAMIHGRVELLNSKGTYLLVHARKLKHVPDSMKPPQQSDYLSTWSGHLEEKKDGSLKSYLRSRLSPKSMAIISGYLNRLRNKRAVWRWRFGSRLSNRKLYRPVREWTMTTREAFNY